MVDRSPWQSLWRRLSGPTLRKASAAAQVIALQGVGQPVWTPRNFQALAKEGFIQNAIVHRSVRMIAEGLAAIPFVIYENDRELDSHPLLDLLARPNPLQSGAELIEALVAFLQVSGNGYLEAVATEGAPRELYALRPDRMSVVLGADGWPEAYDYAVAGGKVRYRQTGQAATSPILHLRQFHPLDDHYGLSPLEAAATSVDVHNAGAAWTKALLDNAARPSGALVYKGPDGAPNLTEEQFHRLKDELETSFQGARNAGRPLLLDGGLSWTSMSLSPHDLDFIEARHVAAREIALAFGVPPMLLGIPGDNTYANYREANLALWRHTILPLGAKLIAALNGWLAPRFEGRLRLAHDLDQVPALASERDAVWQRLAAAHFLTVDEKRAAVGYGPLESARHDD